MLIAKLENMLIKKKRWRYSNDIKIFFISCRRSDLEPDCEIMVCEMQVSNVKK